MKIIIAPDKFKGSLTSFEACEAMESALQEVLPLADIATFPMADGGDGFSSVLKFYLGSTSREQLVINAMGKPIMATYEWLEADKLAIVETAAASGLAGIQPMERNALLAHTRGTGMLIAHAIKQGAEKILLGLGGSASTDMGTGILHELGFSFLDTHSRELLPCGGMLGNLEEVIFPEPLPKVKFLLACDVFNVLHGPNGAAFVYGPQKGADTDMVKKLDAGLKHANNIFGKYSGRDMSTLAGSGAAGGIAAGLAHFFDIEIKSGFDLIIEKGNLVQSLQGADWLLTGEGKLDRQSFEGKVVGKLVELASSYRVKVGVFCGEVEGSITGHLPDPVQWVSQIIEVGMSSQWAIDNAGDLLRKLVIRSFQRQ